MLRIISLFIVLVMLISIITIAQEEDTLGITIMRDIPYVDAEGESVNPRQTLDLYLPEDVENFPLLMYVHGGVWRLGSKDDYQNIGLTFAQAGFGVAIINYRLTPEVVHPAHTEDVAQALNWLLDNSAEYGGDPERIVLSGHSAGGHIISLLALDSQYLDAVNRSVDDIMGIVGYSGVYVIDDWIVQWGQGVFPEDDPSRDEASPLRLIPDDGENLPPFLLLVSENDYPELIVETEDMHNALDAIDVIVEWGIIDNRDHFGLVNRIGSADDETTTRVLAWLTMLFDEESEEIS